MTTNYLFDPFEPLDGYEFLNETITFDNKKMRYSIIGKHFLTKKQLLETMLEMTIEYNDGEIVTIKDILPEEHSEMIRWCLDDMKIDIPYPINDIKQKDKIMGLWDVLHLQNEFEFKISDDYSHFMKVRNGRDLETD